MKTAIKAKPVMVIVVSPAPAARNHHAVHRRASLPVAVIESPATTSKLRGTM